MPATSRPAEGTVKWFNARKGFGFLTPDGGGEDVFLHLSSFDGGGDLRPGARVRFDLVIDPRGARAAHVRVIAPPPPPRPWRA